MAGFGRAFGRAFSIVRGTPRHGGAGGKKRKYVRLEKDCLVVEEADEEIPEQVKPVRVRKNKAVPIEKSAQPVGDDVPLAVIPIAEVKLLAERWQRSQEFYRLMKYRKYQVLLAFFRHLREMEEEDELVLLMVA